MSLEYRGQHSYVSLQESPQLQKRPGMMSSQFSSLYNCARTARLLAFVFEIGAPYLLPNLAETEELSKQLASLALGVGFLREHSRQTNAAAIFTIDETNSALVWSLIQGALTSSLLPRPLCTVSRSAQGFLAVPLCSLIENGDIDDLCRLHGWLPDGQRGNPDLAIHSH